MSMHVQGGQPLTGWEPTADELTPDMVAEFRDLLTAAPDATDPWYGVDVTDWDEYDHTDEAMQESMTARHRVRRMRVTS